MDRVLQKAGYELWRYLKLMTGEEGDIAVSVEPGSFDVPDAAQDDAYRIDVTGGKGSITASNPRAALIAVYHLLRDNGCAFVRPGKASERVPHRALGSIASKRTVTAGHRFRGICIEGSCFLESTLDVLEWMPKVGFNCYFMQFREGYGFYQRWYEAEGSTAKSPWEFDLDVCRDIVAKVVNAAHENGLMYHAIGHGFTCECYGVHALGWQEFDEETMPAEFRKVLAMRNGKRDLAWKIPLISALCYSDPEVQKQVVAEAADYIEAHPEIDYVHFWLDDGNNNKCECENCRDTIVAEYYIQMLNDLDARLTAKGVKTKVVFLAYHELLWPPVREKLMHPERFTFMFAPIQRSFTEPFTDVDKVDGKMNPYTLNHQPFPKNNDEMANHLKAWNDYRDSIGMPLEDSFDFDYYGSPYNDPGQYVQAELLYRDIHHLRQNGLGGIVNCQPERAYDQAALPIYLMARSLTQPELSFEEVEKEFFEGAFGENWQPYRDLWREMTAGSLPLRNCGGSHEDFEALKALLQKPLPEDKVSDLATSHSRKLMRLTMDIFLRMTEILQAVLEKTGEAEALEKAFVDFVSSKECEFRTELDVRSICGKIRRYMRAGAEKADEI